MSVEPHNYYARIEPNPGGGECRIFRDATNIAMTGGSFTYDTHCTSRVQKLWASIKSAFGFGSCITLHLPEQRGGAAAPERLSGTQVFWINNEHRAEFNDFSANLNSSQRWNQTTVDTTSRWANRFFNIQIQRSE